MSGNRAERGWWPGWLDVPSLLAAKAIGLAWFAGLAWFSWLAPDPMSVPWQGYLLLIAMVAPAVIVLGIPIFLTVRSLSNRFEGRTVPPAIFFGAGIGILLSAVLSFLGAAVAVRLFAGFPVPRPDGGFWFYLAKRH